MIDILLQVFGPHLAEKLFSKREEITTRELAEAIVEVGEDTHKHEESIERMEKEIKSLSPVNIGSELEAISKWMKKHVDSEELALREMVRNQKRWNHLLCFMAGTALLVAILSFFR